jgi:hypothetical protein
MYTYVDITLHLYIFSLRVYKYKYPEDHSRQAAFQGNKVARIRVAVGPKMYTSQMFVIHISVTVSS